MKQLTCEMCGSTELVKQDGYFVCQFCGCKYSVEEAKKMMIEGTVDVQGTVKVDNTAFVEKYLANARRAMQKEDWQEVEKYYNMVEQNDPTNIEAIFYSAYGKAKHALVEVDIHKIEAAFKILQNSVSVIDDNFSMQNEPAHRQIIIRITSDVCNLVRDYKHDNKEMRKRYHLVRNYQWQQISLFSNIINELVKTINNIIPKYESCLTIEKDRVLYLYKAIIDLYSSKIENKIVAGKLKKKYRADIAELYVKIRRINPNYVISNPNLIKGNKSSFFQKISSIKCDRGSFSKKISSIKCDWGSFSKRIKKLLLPFLAVLLSVTAVALWIVVIVYFL